MLLEADWFELENVGNESKNVCGVSLTAGEVDALEKQKEINKF